MLQVMEAVYNSFSFLEPLIFYLTNLKDLNKSLPENKRGKTKSLKTHVLVFKIASCFFPVFTTGQHFGWLMKAKTFVLDFWTRSTNRKLIRPPCFPI